LKGGIAPTLRAHGSKASTVVATNLRAQLLAILGVATLSFAVLLITGTTSDARMETQLRSIARQHVPTLELGSKLSAELDKLQRALQDAAAAEDAEALELTHGLRDELLIQASVTPEGTASPELVMFKTALNDYYAAAYELSRRLLAHETGHDLSGASAVMQARHRRAKALLEQATQRSQRQLKQAFENAAAAQASLRSSRLLVSLSCLCIVLALSLWMSRRILSAVGDLGAGLVRYGASDFRVPIRITSHDEFGELARKANAMATNLERLQKERDQTDWLKSGQAGLVLELQGDMEPAQVAERAARFLSNYLGAPAVAVYQLEPDQSFSLLAACGADHKQIAEMGRTRFLAMEGQLGRAVASGSITVLKSVPPDYVKIRSGLGEAAPTSLILAPLLHVGKVVGVLELAFFGEIPANALALLEAASVTLAITLEVARSRSAVRSLLTETQTQAARLLTQEEELRATNEELHTQQEGLRDVNAALTRQTNVLEQQRQELERKNNELTEARQILEAKAKELETVSAYKSQFLANMSHELRTPLNSMLLLSNLLADNAEKNLTEKQVEYCRTVYQSGKNLLSLINQVLDLSKVEAGKQNVQLESVAVHDLVTHTRRVFEPLARDKGLALRMDLQTLDLPSAIVTDPKRLEQILNNLLGNAVKFTERGAVTLRVGLPAEGNTPMRNDLSREQCIAFEVSDTGIGVEPSHQQRIFAPFEQLESQPDRRYGGTGLGLTISRELASLLGGELQLKSTAGEGSTFTLLLPFVAPAQEVLAISPKALRTDSAQAVAALPREPVTAVGVLKHPVSATDAVAAENPSGVRPDLLIIEDDTLFSAALGEVVRGQGLTHMIARNGATGFELAKLHRPRGIALDVKLSDIDGFSVLQMLRADASTRDIPVHFVSGLNASERGMSLGAVGYLSKPASHAELLGLVEALTPARVLPQCRVLIIEDDRPSGDSLLQALVEDGFEASLVENAEEGLALLQQQTFHCLVLDLGLPGMDGLALLGSLQASETTMPAVVVYTGRPFTKPELHTLKRYTEAVVMKDGGATQRVLDELHGFAQQLKCAGSHARGGERSSSESIDWQGKKILIADDDMRAVYALSALLREHGAEPVVADTGSAALQALSEHPDVEAVLIDIIMPEMDGYEAMRRIRGMARFSALPIVALTAKAMKVDRQQCLEAGATSYLTKPVDAEVLFAVLNEHLRARHRAHERH
jgi:signal transduction histidine kinase/CheY-like chemotaxis protein